MTTNAIAYALTTIYKNGLEPSSRYGQQQLVGLLSLAVDWQTVENGGEVVATPETVETTNDPVYIEPSQYISVQ